jgi:hypothetical protein
MGTKTINPVSVALAGAKITKTDTGGTTGSIIVAPTIAQSSLNFEDLFVVVENYSTTASCVVTVKAGDVYSEVCIGDAPSVSIATDTTKVIGGKELESARFKDKDGYLNLDITATATCYVYAIMQPFTILNPK